MRFQHQVKIIWMVVCGGCSIPDEFHSITSFMLFVLAWLWRNPPSISSSANAPPAPGNKTFSALECFPPSLNELVYLSPALVLCNICAGLISCHPDERSGLGYCSHLFHLQIYVKQSGSCCHLILQNPTVWCSLLTCGQVFLFALLTSAASSDECKVWEMWCYCMFGIFFFSHQLRQVLITEVHPHSGVQTAVSLIIQNWTPAAALLPSHHPDPHYSPNEGWLHLSEITDPCPAFLVRFILMLWTTVFVLQGWKTIAQF